MNFTIFCGSKSGVLPEYVEAAHQLGSELAQRDFGVVYGGSSIGLMGAVADSALEAGGKVTGVITTGLAELEISHHGLDKLHVVDTMHQRKALMTDLADAFIVLPGGIGTLDETFETLTWLQLDIHQKPLGFLNIECYFDQLYAFLDHQVTQGFVHQEDRKAILCLEQPKELIEALIADR